MTSTARPAQYSSAQFIAADESRLHGAPALLRGVQRLLRANNYESISEMPLGNGQRADVLAIGPAGDIWIIEIKSSIADFRADRKWTNYRDYCDCLSFAVTPDFPAERIPEDTGLILADAYGGEIMRSAPRHELSAARRRAMTLTFARTAAMRLNGLIDPCGQLG